MGILADRINSNRFTLIAEIGVNYYDIAKQRGISNMDAAKLMCKEAKSAGVHAVKFQTYKADELAVGDSPYYWDIDEEPTRTQRDLFRKYDRFGEKEYIELASYCDSIGIPFCSTAFDFESADYLCPIMDVYKVSSSDLTNLPFIEYQAMKGKPIIMSVGAGDFDEIRAAVQVVRSVSSAPLVLCHCVLEYPTPYVDANLRRIIALAHAFPNTIIGYSDHCKFNADIIKTAYILGARVIEKHFTLDKTLQGNDHYHAMDTNDARRIIEDIEFVETILGDCNLRHLDSESNARLHARRSIVAAASIPKGLVIQREHLSFKRPGFGIPPSEIDQIIGKVANREIKRDEILTIEMLNDAE